ncbi:MAG: dTDP-4-dehydrorhamnose 3,5-epimerase family protein [Bacteroidota bacterium]
MEINESKKVRDLKIIKPDSFYDFRGEYLETFNAEKYKFKDSQGNDVVFVEDDISVSKNSVLRGLHGDDKTWKLIQCLWGEIYVAVVDMRKASATYLQWETFAINDKNRWQLLIPAGCANGHLCLSEKCIFSYKQSQIYSGMENQFTVRWDDPKLNIFWPVKNPLVSVRDSSAKFIDEPSNK